jgi:hypothetical protein
LFDEFRFLHAQISAVNLPIQKSRTSNGTHQNKRSSFFSVRFLVNPFARSRFQNAGISLEDGRTRGNTIDRRHLNPPPPLAVLQLGVHARPERLDLLRVVAAQGFALKAKEFETGVFHK